MQSSCVKWPCTFVIFALFIASGLTLAQESQLPEPLESRPLPWVEEFSAVAINYPHLDPGSKIYELSDAQLQDLRALFADYNDMTYGAAFRRLRSKEERFARVQLLLEFQNAPNVIAQARQIIGPENEKRYIQSRNRCFLGLSNGITAEGLTNLVTRKEVLDKFSQALDFTTAQRSRLEKYFAEQKARIDARVNEWTRSIGDIRMEYFERDMGILDGEQHRKYIKVVGRPIDWAKIIEETKMRPNYRYQASGDHEPDTSQPKHFGRVGNSHATDGAFEAFVDGTVTIDQLEAEGITVIDSNFLELLKSKLLEAVLELNQPESEKIAKIVEDWSKGGLISTNQIYQDRIRMALAGDAELIPEEIRKAIGNAKSRKLIQLELQMRFERIDPWHFGLLDRRVSDWLNLSPDQTGEIRRIGREYRKAVQNRERERAEEIATLKQEMAGEIFQMFSDEQRRRLADLTGIQLATETKGD